MDTAFDRALRLWASPVPPGEAGPAAFAEVYRDPVVINGVSTALSVLADRARMLQAALDGLHHEIVERTDAEGRLAVAFRLSGRHVGPLETPLGTIAPTGRDVSVVAMDIFVIDDDGMVAEIWAVADYLDLLRQLDAVQLNPS